MAEGWDDETLLAALRQALHARQAVAPEFVEAGQNAFAWHNIDAELAQLTYDSTRDSDYAPSTRTETASIRALTFTSAHLTIELEVTSDSLLGQIIPTQTAAIKVQSRAGAETVVVPVSGFGTVPGATGVLVGTAGATVGESRLTTQPRDA